MQLAEERANNLSHFVNLREDSVLQWPLGRHSELLNCQQTFSYVLALKNNYLLFTNIQKIHLQVFIYIYLDTAFQNRGLFVMILPNITVHSSWFGKLMLNDGRFF